MLWLLQIILVTVGLGANAWGESRRSQKASVAEPRVERGFEYINLTWHRNGSVDFRYRLNGRENLLEAKLMREGDHLEFREVGLLLNVHAHSSSFISVVVIRDQRELAEALILERVNGRYTLIPPVIKGDPFTLRADLDNSLVALQAAKGWDHTIGLRATLAFFSAFPDRTMADFYSTVLENKISMVARPQMRRGNQWATRALPKNVKPVDGAQTPQNPPLQQAESGGTQNVLPPATKPKRKQGTSQRKPYEPRPRNPGGGGFGIFDFIFGN